MPSAASVSSGPSSRSASAIVADTASGYHVLRIDRYSLTKQVTPTGKYIKSRPFTVGGHRWYLRYYPNGNVPEVADYISVFLCLAETPSSNKEVKVKVQFQLRLVSSKEAPKKPLTSKNVTVFEHKPGRWGWGQHKFIQRTKLEESSSEHLKDDSFAVRCDVIVVNGFRGEDVDEAEVAASSAASSVSPVPPSDLHQHLGDLLLTEKGTDVAFEVGGETFRAHRCVLAARSPVFSAELFGTMKESVEGVVRVDDMEARAFKALLHFAYTDSLPKPTMKGDQEEEEETEDEDVMCQYLLVAADRYNLERLKLICEEKLSRHIDVRTVAALLTLAEQHRCHGLKKACFGFLSSPENLKAVMDIDGFDHLSRSCPSIMKELLVMLLPHT